MLRSGAVVCADNVIMAEINDYLHFVRTSPLFINSTLYTSYIEYSEPERLKYGDESMKDGVEVSIFKGEELPSTSGVGDNSITNAWACFEDSDDGDDELKMNDDNQEETH